MSEFIECTLIMQIRADGYLSENEVGHVYLKVLPHVGEKMDVLDKRSGDVSSFLVKGVKHVVSYGTDFHEVVIYVGNSI